MITYNKQICPNEEDQSRLERLGNLDDLLFFDIETTGFNRIYDHIISITFMYLENKTWIITQLFAESLDDEFTLLNHGTNLFNDKKIHITYNGNAFDIPFLNIKYVHYNISASLNKSKSYDLYPMARKALSLENYKLKSIEKHLGIERIDEISGLECIENYKAYLATGDMQYANLILEHNFEDVLNLLALTKIIDYLTPEALNSFKVQYFVHNKQLYYYNTTVTKTDYIEIALWRYKPTIDLENQPVAGKINFYYENGAQIVEENNNILLIKLPIYSKEINDNQVSILDYESLDLWQSKTTEEGVQQNILQFNQFYVYEHLNKAIIGLFDKSFK